MKTRIGCQSMIIIPNLNLLNHQPQKTTPFHPSIYSSLVGGVIESELPALRSGLLHLQCNMPSSNFKAADNAIIGFNTVVQHGQFDTVTCTAVSQALGTMQELRNMAEGMSAYAAMLRAHTMWCGYLGFQWLTHHCKPAVMSILSAPQGQMTHHWLYPLVVRLDNCVLNNGGPLHIPSSIISGFEHPVDYLVPFDWKGRPSLEE